MADGGMTAGLLALSAASTGAGMAQSRAQQRLETATIKADTEMAKLQTQERAYQTSQNFRKALASQLALSSLRGATGTSLTRQFAAESISNMLADQKSFDRRQRFLDTAAGMQRSQAKANRFARDFSSVGSLLTAGIGAVDLNKG